MVSGSASMMVTGWKKLSNCAASTMYVSTMLSRNAMPKLALLSASVLARPVNSRLKRAGVSNVAAAFCTCSAAVARGSAGRRFPLTVIERWRFTRSISAGPRSSRTRTRLPRRTSWSARVRHHVELRERALAEVLQAHVERAGGDVALARLHAPALVADGGEHVGHAAQVAHVVLDLAEDAARLGEREPARGLDVDLELALVVLREEGLADDADQGDRREHRPEREQHDRPAVAERPG